MTDAPGIAEIEAERTELELPRFDENVAWRIGCLVRERAAADAYPIAIEISRTGGRLFYAALPGASPDNEAWIHRKRSVVERFLESSLLMTLRTEAAGTNIIDRYKLSPVDYVHSGGAVAIRVRGCGVIGAVTVSGLTQFDDHRLGGEALRAVRTELR